MAVSSAHVQGSFAGVPGVQGSLAGIQNRDRLQGYDRCSAFLQGYRYWDFIRNEPGAQRRVCRAAHT